MKFQLDSLEDLHRFQNQTLHVQLSKLSHGKWQSDLSSWLFEAVYISIVQKESKHVLSTKILKSSAFIMGSSFLNEPPSERGGVVLFPLGDILSIWIRTLYLPETLVSQIFLESIFQKDLALHIDLAFTPIHRLYHSELPLKRLPSVQYSVVPYSSPFAGLIKSRNGPG